MSQALDRLNEALAGRYRVERELGQGGMAVVYLARDLRHDRNVAIKMLDPELAMTIGSDRFSREIEIAARLAHPHILPLFDSGAYGPLLYYVMPVVEGGSLRARLDRDGTLPVDDALRLTREVASALGHAHGHGLIHRDIKPENILLSDGIALLADFGIARGPTTGSTQLTQVGMMLGTPTYMAPEQILGGDVDARADLYALACVLYEMLAGEPPFTGVGPGIIHRVLSEAPRPIEERRAGLPHGISAVVAQALAKTPEERFATAARFAEALSMPSATTTVIRPAVQREAPHNLPRSRTHFIGREKELAELERLAGDARLVTLTGIGGCGKTRLALRWAEQSLAAHPDGVWFVDLAPLSDPERVVQVVATAVGLREEPGTPLLESLRRHLARAQVLLVLDNCEHLLSACAELVDDLLERTQALRVLATSRESLGVDGERAIGVRSLTVPAASSDLTSIEASDSVRLFVDRARRVAPDFQLTAANASAIAEICRRLDGIPLAIEFAAARVELLSVDQIRAKLDDRFRLLTGGGKALPRQQTLQATIQWSYDHVAADEQRVFRLLSVFAAGWSLSSAAAVMGEVDEFEALDPLTRLVQKSLVVVQREGGGEPRYRMLETVRQFASDRLGDSGESADARTRHLEYFTAFMTDAGARLVGPEQIQFLRRIDVEIENILAAHGWCDQVPDGATRGLRLVADLPLYWTDRGLLELGLRVFREALARPDGHPVLRMAVLLSAGRLAFHAHRYDDAEAFATESLALATERGAADRALWAQHLLGAIAYTRGALDQARTLYENVLVRVHESGDTRALADVTNLLGAIHHAQGDLDGAARHYAQSLELKRTLGNVRDVAIVLHNLSQLELQRGRLEDARRSARESLDYVDQSGSKLGAQSLLETAAAIAAAGSDFPRVARWLGAARAMMGKSGAPTEPDDPVLRPVYAGARETLGEGEFGSAYDGGQKLSFTDGVAEVRDWLGNG